MEKIDLGKRDMELFNKENEKPIPPEPKKKETISDPPLDPITAQKLGSAMRPASSLRPDGISSDVDGSYTGVSADYSQPVQDADDL